MRHSEKFLLLFSLSITSLIFATPFIRAQDLDNVTITGRVTDQNGAVIPGAIVTATLLATRIQRTIVGGDDGQYKLIQLSPGT